MTADIIQLFSASTNTKDGNERRKSASDASNVTPENLAQWQSDLPQLATDIFKFTAHRVDGDLEKTCDLIMMQLIYHCMMQADFTLSANYDNTDKLTFAQTLLSQLASIMQTNLTTVHHNFTHDDPSTDNEAN